MQIRTVELDLDFKNDLDKKAVYFRLLYGLLFFKNNQIEKVILKNIHLAEFMR